MAKAPDPGQAKKNEQARAVRTIVKVTYEGESLEFPLRNLPMRTEMECEQITGKLPVELVGLYVRGQGISSGPWATALLWLARRCNGQEANLVKIRERWPDDFDYEEGPFLSIDEDDDEQVISPEGSGPAS